MTLIAKIDPPMGMAEDGVAQIRARPYQKATTITGEEIFVWTAKRSSGHALAARGTVLGTRIETVPNASGTGTHKELVVDIRLTGGAPLRPLSTDQIDPLRESPATAAAPTYTHALNKITSLEPDVADFVRSHFEEV